MMLSKILKLLKHPAEVRDEIAWAEAHGVPTITGHDHGNPSAVFGVTKAVDEAFGKENVEVVGMCWKRK